MLLTTGTMLLGYLQGSKPLISLVRDCSEGIGQMAFACLQAAYNALEGGTADKGLSSSRKPAQTLGQLKHCT